MYSIFMESQRNFRVGAALGLAVWLAALVILQPEWAAALLLLGALVIVPLGLALLGEGTEQGQVSALGQFAAALCLVASFAVSQAGTLAAVLTVPWLVFTFAAASAGVLRTLQRTHLNVETCVLDAGMIFLAIGGVWTTASRYGAGLMGFEEPIVLLTGAHFHFAGFALPVLTGLAGHRLRSNLALIAAVGVIAGVPLTAIGITVKSRWPLVEVLTSWELAAACVLVSILQLQLAIRPGPRAVRLLLSLSGGSLLCGMGLAAVYALSEFTHENWLDIPTMIRWHASINALGFALPGLLAWTLHPSFVPEKDKSMQILFRVLRQRANLESWEARPIASGVHEGPRPADARDVHERVVAQEPPGPPEPDGPFQRLAHAIGAFRIFPESMVDRLVRREPIQVGDTVGGSYHLMPGIDLIFASRVTAVFDAKVGTHLRAGFTYQTLEGHPELGEETFSVEKNEVTGDVRVALRSWSRPGAWLTRLTYPYARRSQLRAGRAALDNLERISRAQAPLGHESNQSAVLTRSK